MEDPETWISELLYFKEQLRVLGAMMTDEDIIIHLLNNLPEEYNNAVEILDIEMTSTTNPLMLTSVR